MEPFKYKDKVITFSWWTGTVTDSQKRSETHISSSGGYGYIHNGTGSITSPRIHSTVINKHEIWLKHEDGTESTHKIGGADIPLRVGQKVTLIAGFPQTETGWNLLLYNYNAQKYWYVLNTDEICDYYKLTRKWGREVYLGTFLLFPIVSILPMFLGDQGSQLVVFTMPLGLGLALYYIFTSKKRVNAERERIANLLRQHLNTRLTQIISKT